jgi:hypothetical protein
MTLSESDYIQLIVAEVGDDGHMTLASTVPIYWARYAGIADLETRFLSVKLSAIDLMLGRVRGRVTIRDGDGASVDLNKLFDHLTTMREQVLGQINTVTQAGSSGAASGDLTHTAPVMPPAGSMGDANSADYRGNPYQRRRFRR